MDIPKVMLDMKSPVSQGMYFKKIENSNWPMIKILILFPQGAINSK